MSGMADPPSSSREAAAPEAVTGDRTAEDEARRVDEIRRAADRVCALILYSDLPLIDVRIAAAEARRLCRQICPGDEALFDRIYGARFRRLWAQWRGGEIWR